MTELTITPERRRLFNGTVLLGHMAAHNLRYDVLLPGSQTNLESILQWLMTRSLVKINDKNFYEVSQKGQAVISLFKRRYQKILQYFDVFAAVDLEAGDFAMAHTDEFEKESQWFNFLNADRWEDLRIAAAQYLGADPIELVFSHFMQEGRFNFTDGGWEISLLEGLIWNEIEEVCQNSLMIEDLAYGSVSGSSVISEIVEEGFLLVRHLSDYDPKLMAHLARWAPSRKATDVDPDNSSQPFWKSQWQLKVI